MYLNTQSAEVLVSLLAEIGLPVVHITRMTMLHWVDDAAINSWWRQLWDAYYNSMVGRDNIIVWYGKRIP